MTTRTIQVSSTTVKLVAAIGLLCLGSGQATAETGHWAYVRTAFSAEGHLIRTTACLRVTEKMYGRPAWWTDADGNASAPERTLKAVIAAIAHKDRAALWRVAHPTQGRDQKRFEEQAAVYFQQFDVIELVAIPRAYEFDGFAVFFAQLRYKEQTIFAPFIFAAEDDGSFGFLPYRTTAVTYRLVQDWFDSTWATAAPTDQIYCTERDIKRATHRIVLGSSSRPFATQLFLIGASFDKPGETANLVARVKSTMEHLKSSLASGGDFAKYMTPKGGRRLRDWFASADQAERRTYAATIIEQQPFFLFDASPLMVVYTKSRGRVGVMYFTFNSSEELLWTNSSHIVDADKVYKHGPLYDAASLDKPFSSIAIK